jgi:hypothetical protein
MPERVKAINPLSIDPFQESFDQMQHHSTRIDRADGGLYISIDRMQKLGAAKDRSGFLSMAKPLL